MVPALRAARQMVAGVLERDLVAVVGEGLADRAELDRHLGVRGPGRATASSLEHVDVGRDGGVGLRGVEGVLAEVVEGHAQAVVDERRRWRVRRRLGGLAGDVAA